MLAGSCEASAVEAASAWTEVIRGLEWLERRAIAMRMVVVEAAMIGIRVADPMVHNQDFLEILVVWKTDRLFLIQKALQEIKQKSKNIFG